MANRHLLAVNKLQDFEQWLIKNGWHIEEVKSQFEVLRARKETEPLPLIVYKKDKKGLVHLSVSDWNAKYVKQYIEHRDEKNQQDVNGSSKQIEELHKDIENLTRNCNRLFDENRELEKQLAEKDKELETVKNLKAKELAEALSCVVENLADVISQKLDTATILDIVQKYNQDKIDQQIKELKGEK